VRLALYNSTPRGTAPNLVGLQDEAFATLPTVLVCPLKAGISVTAFRAEVSWASETLVACTDLTRPIRRTALRPIGHLDDATSRLILERFQRLLAR
jgi:mRNA-degrading endonuclease toxin of MazEF toxin-antitoxin module